MTSPENDAFVRSFARGLSVIEAMGRGTGSHTVASVADATQLPRTVARRILLTLAQLGYAVADDKGFRLTPKILNLSLTYLTSLPFWGAAQGVLEQLCVELKESAALSVFDGRDAVYLMRVPSAKVTPLRLGVGSHVPAYNTSPGRVFLAWQEAAATQQYLAAVELKPHTPRTITSPTKLLAALAVVRARGHAWVDGEFNSMFSGLAIPVHNERGQVVAALSVNLLSGETTQAKAVKVLLNPLRSAAQRLQSMAPSFLGAASQSARVPMLQHS